MSFSFLLGILACCISAFVSINRFGFALEGAWCAVDRIYYDSLYGQLKNSEPKWEGFDKITNISTSLYHFANYIKENNDWKNDLLPNKDDNTKFKDKITIRLAPWAAIYFVCKKRKSKS